MRTNASGRDLGLAFSSPFVEGGQTQPSIENWSRSYPELTMKAPHPTRSEPAFSREAHGEDDRDHHETNDDCDALFFHS